MYLTMKGTVQNEAPVFTLTDDIESPMRREGLDPTRCARSPDYFCPVASAKPDEVIDLNQQGLSVPEIAKRLPCSRSTVKRWLKEREMS